MRKFIFTTILLFLALGQVWARTYSGGEILYVRNYRPSEWGSGTDNWKQSGGEFWATFDASETQVKPSRLEPTGDWNDVGTVYCFVVPDGEHTTVTLHRGDKYEYPTWSGKTNAITLDATKNYIYDGYNTDASTANWQDLPMFSNGSTMYLIRGWNWSQSNERYAAYFFDGVNSEWVDLTNHSGDIFKCTIPTRKWAYMIMCRMNGSQSANNWSNKWMQTQNIAPSGTGNCVYITDNDPNDGTATSNWRLGKYAATPAITGGMNDWSPVANQFSGSPLQLTMSLSAGKAYQFKVALGEDNSWYGRNNTYDNDLVFVGQTDAETLYSGEHNLMLMTAEAGTYTFEWNSEDHKLTITYPSAGNHPSANYYYITKNASSTRGWNSGNYIYLNFWNGSGPLGEWASTEPKLEDSVEINDVYYYYVPVLADYTSFKAHEKKDGSSGYTTGDQTLAGHAGQFIDCVESTWGWHDFSFNVEEHNNGGRIWSDSIGSYTFGVGATLPTNITRWAYDFAGWYDNAELSGEPVTAISTTDNGDKDYYAKWASIAQTYPIAEHPEFLAAQEGDIIAVTVTGVHTSAAIYLYDLNYTEITHLSISATGTYTFPLSAAAAAGLREKGLQVTGQNFTFSDVDIRYRKTIWEGEVDATGNWEQSDAISNALFADLQAGDFLGVTVNKINYNKDSWHTYAIRAAWRTNIISHNMSDTGVGVDILTEALVDSLQNKTIILVSSYLSCNAIHTYTHTRVYNVTLNTNSGTINAGDVTSYTFGTGATLPTDVTRTGYTFAGWYPDAEFEGARVYSISTTDYGAKTYYAKWTVNVYTVEEHTNGGKINADSIGNYTYGVGATLPTDVTRWGYKFAGWYDNEELEGDPVTAISTTDNGDKDYYAQWTEISETLLAASGHPEFLAAEEGDILVITVTNVQPSAQIFLANTSSVEIDHKSISTTGKYAFQLSASAATALHNGVIITGVNYTKSSVALLYKKTLWSGTLTSPKDAEPWQVQSLTQSDFADIADGDYVGFTVSSINDGETWHQYSLYYYDSDNQLVKSNTQSTTGTFLEAIPDGKAAGLADGNNAVFIVAQYLTLTGFHRYISTRDYTVTLNTNSGTINADDVTGYTYPIGATLPTNVTRDGYRFDGWFANEGLTGEPVTTITTSDYGNKTYWAKWTSLEQTKTPANYSRLNVAEAGDILVVNVTAISAGSSIKINKSADGSNLFTKTIAATGKYAFQLSASDATALHTGMILSGTNYTGTVELLLRKTIWHDVLKSPQDKEVWITADLTHSDLAGIADGDYVGFTVSAINTGEFHQYNLCAYKDETYVAANNTTNDAGTYIETIKSGFATHLLDEDKSVFIAAQNLTLSDFYRYLPTRDYTVTLNTNGGTINAGNITSYTYLEGATLPTDVTRTNYTFMGWYDNEELNGDPVTSITTTDLGNKEYWAKWTFVIYRTGDAPDGGIETFAGGTISEIIEYRMNVNALDQWYSLYLPFDVDSVCVWDTDDRKYYKIEPYYRPKVDDALIGGHYLIRTPVTATDLSLANFGDWRDPTTNDWVPSKNTPYIIQWHLAYFENMYVSFFGHTDEDIPTSMTAGAAPSLDNVVNVYGNDAMVEGSVTGAYLLEGDYGSYGAWLRDEDPDASRTILPFECYIVAKSTTRARYRVLRRGMSIEETATGWEDVINSERKTCVEVYTITGYRLTQYNDCSFSETAQRLNAEYGAGMYILRAGNESVKLMLEGGK